MAKRAVNRPTRSSKSELAHLAERAGETPRKLVQRLIEAVTSLIQAVTSRLARRTPKSGTTKAAHARRAPRKSVTHRTAKRPI